MRSNANQIQLNLCIAVFARPQIQRGSINFIDQRRSESNPSEIDSFEVVLASVTGFNPHMIEFWRMKVSQFCRSLLAAVRANDTTEFPREKAGRADQITIAALGRRLFVLEETNLGIATAERAVALTRGNLSADWSAV